MSSKGTSFDGSRYLENWLEEMRHSPNQPYHFLSLYPYYTLHITIRAIQYSSLYFSAIYFSACAQPAKLRFRSNWISLTAWLRGRVYLHVHLHTAVPQWIYYVYVLMHTYTGCYRNRRLNFGIVFYSFFII